MRLSPIWTRLALPLAAILALFTLALGFTVFPQVNAASTPGTVIFTPTSGPVGTSVQVFVHQPLTETTPVMYALGFTLTDPEAGGCASQQPFPGVAPFGSSEANGEATFNWPASLNKGPYWLCARPTSGNGKTVFSSQPYTVTAGEMPTATVGTTSGAVIADVPTDGVVVGSTFTLTIRHWASSRGTPPEAVNLTAQDPSQQDGSSGSKYSAQFTIAPGPSAGDYVLTVTVPDKLVPLTYWAEVSDQGGSVYSGPFKVLAPAAPPPPPVSSPGTSSADGSSFHTILAFIIVILICVAVIMLTSLILRRRARLYR
jgi:hypothetical protein